MQTVTHQVLPADAGRLDTLVARLTGFSRARVRGLLDHGGARLDGAPVSDAGLRLLGGELLQLRFDPERRYKEKPAERATRGFALVFLDEHLAVVDKAAGTLTVPTPRGEPHTLLDLLSNHLNKGRKGRRVSVVHRLDRDTSGLLVFGRTPQIAKDLIAQFAARKPEREYAAIVSGRVPLDRGRVESLLASDEALNQKSVAKNGELAITHYEVRQRYESGATLVAVNLETGRRNQIRVHFAELGHPVLGDERYRAEDARHARWPYPRLALHARVLGFRHPVTREPLRFESALPREFTGFR